MLYLVKYQKFSFTALHLNSAKQNASTLHNIALPIFHRSWPSLAKRPVGKSDGERMSRLAKLRTPTALSDAVRSAANLVIRTLTKSFYCWGY